MTDLPETPNPDSPQNESWMAAASRFVSARIDLIKLEARDAGQEAAKRGALLAVILICTFLIWLLTVAALVGWISHSQGWPWYGVTFVAAGLHLLIAIIAIVMIKKPAAPSFPLTRAELAKDQAWLETLNQDPKSRN